MKTRQQVSIAVLAATTALCLIPGLANAQSTYRSDRNGKPVYDSPGNGGRPGDNDRLNGTLSTRQQRVDAGSSVTFGYSVKNEGRDTRTYRFSSSRMFDLEAVRVDVGRDRDDRRGGFGRGNNGNNGRRVIWRYSDDQLGAQVISEFTLRPGQIRSFVARWQVGRDIPAGTYEVTAFLTPQRDNRTGVSTTRIIVENSRGQGNGNGNGGWNGGNGNGNNNGNSGWNGNDRDVIDVTDLVRSNSSRYVDRRITVRGIYKSNGSGNNSWLLDGDNITALVVNGPLPRNGKVNDRVTVTGTLRQGRNGRLTLENN